MAREMRAWNEEMDREYAAKETFSSKFRYRLRTLLLLTILGPPALA